MPYIALQIPMRAFEKPYHYVDALVLASLEEDIVRRVANIEALGIGADFVTVHAFTPFSLKTDIIVDIRFLYEKLDRTPMLLKELADSVWDAVAARFPNTLIGVFVQGFDPLDRWNAVTEKRSGPREEPGPKG